MSHVTYIYSVMAQQLLMGQRFLIIEVSRSHSDTPHLAGLLWTIDQLDAEDCSEQHAIITRETSLSVAGFEPTIPANEWLQTHSLDHVATGSAVAYIPWRSIL